MNAEYRSNVVFADWVKKSGCGSGEITGSSPVMTWVGGNRKRFCRCGFAGWPQKRRRGGSRDYRVESGNDMGGETANAFVDAAMRRKARQGLEPRK